MLVTSPFASIGGPLSSNTGYDCLVTVNDDVRGQPAAIDAPANASSNKFGFRIEWLIYNNPNCGAY